MKKNIQKTSVNFNLDLSLLTPAQQRLIKSIQAMLEHVAVAEEESEFFESSSELMRMVASLIQQSNFSQKAGEDSSIPYAQQAVEFSLEKINEALSVQKVTLWDN